MPLLVTEDVRRRDAATPQIPWDQGRLIRVAVLFVPLASLYFALAAFLPAYDDELYYWCWAKSLQLSYYDHPALTAWMIAVSTAIFGDTVVAMRLPAIACALVTVGVIFHLSRPRTLLPMVLFSPAFLMVGFLVTPDSPLIAFWALYLLWLVKVHERLESESVPSWLWLVGGVILGCSILGKYTAGLAVPSGFVTFLFIKNWRRWAPGYVAHLSAAFIVTLPILIHNIREDFVPLIYQWRHATDNEPLSFRPIGEFLGIQLLMAGTLPLLMFLWSIRRFPTLTSEPRLRVCACLFVLPFAFFLYKGTRMRLEANWTLICYIAVWPLAAAWYESVRQSLKWRLLTTSFFAVPVVCAAVMLIHIAWPISVVPPRLDRIARQPAKDDVAREVAAKLAYVDDPAPIFVRDYQWTALLRFHQMDARQIEGLERPSQFTQTPDRISDHKRVYVLNEGLLLPEATPGMTSRVVADFPLVVRGQTLSVLWLIEYSKP